MSRVTKPLLLMLMAFALIGGGRRGEYEIKAAFLYKFASAITWPETAFTSDEEPFIVGVLGEDPFEEDLEAVLEGKEIADRPLVLQRYEELAVLRKSHVLFIAESEMDDLDEVLERVGKLPVLTVTDEEGRGDAAMISFRSKNRKIRFQMDVEAIEDAGMVVSEELIEVAKAQSGR